MHDEKKDTKSFSELRKYLLNDYFFDSIVQSLIWNLSKSLWWSFFAKIINEFWEKKNHLDCVACKKKKKNNSCITLYTFT